MEEREMKKEESKMMEERKKRYSSGMRLDYVVEYWTEDEVAATQ